MQWLWAGNRSHYGSLDKCVESSLFDSTEGFEQDFRRCFFCFVFCKQATVYIQKITIQKLFSITFYFLLLQVLKWVEEAVQASKVHLLSTDHLNSAVNTWQIPFDPSLKEVTVSLSGPSPLIEVHDPLGEIVHIALKKNDCSYIGT